MHGGVGGDVGQQVLPEFKRFAAIAACSCRQSQIVTRGPVLGIAGKRLRESGLGLGRHSARCILC